MGAGAGTSRQKSLGKAPHLALCFRLEPSQRYQLLVRSFIVREMFCLRAWLPLLFISVNASPLYVPFPSPTHIQPETDRDQVPGDVLHTHVHSESTLYLLLGSPPYTLRLIMLMVRTLFP